ncbi:hypothetical protein BC332_17815 [Capsicum chinense]|nr:hypothetical protein BC332_17815 [Capsicum chinense]
MSSKNEDSLLTLIATDALELVLLNLWGCDIFVSAYAEILSEGQKGHSCGFDVGTQCAHYASLLWHHRVTKAKEGYTSNNEDFPRPRNSYLQTIDESALVTLE